MPGTSQMSSVRDAITLTHIPVPPGFDMLTFYSWQKQVTKYDSDTVLQLWIFQIFTSETSGAQGQGTSNGLLSNTKWTAEWTHPVDSSEVKVYFNLMPNGFSEKLSTTTQSQVSQLAVMESNQPSLFGMGPSESAVTTPCEFILLLTHGYHILG